MKNRLLKIIYLPLLLLFVFSFLFGCGKNINNISSSSSVSTAVLSSVASSSQPQASSSAAVVRVVQKVSGSNSSPATTTSSKTPSSSTAVTAKPSKYITLTIDATKGHDGIVAKNKQVAVTAGDTVFTVLKRYCSVNKILLYAQKTGGGEYVSSIDGVAQFDNGSESGWLYSVGGKFPSVDCNSYKLNGDETVKWVYTTDDGKTEEGLK